MTICKGTGKQCHNDRRKAEAHLARLNSGCKYGGEIYRCKLCGHLHVGRSGQKTNKKAKRPRRMR